MPHFVGKIGIPDDLHEEKSSLLFLQDIMEMVQEKLPSQIDKNMVLKFSLEVVKDKAGVGSHVHPALMPILPLMHSPEKNALLSYLDPEIVLALSKAQAG